MKPETVSGEIWNIGVPHMGPYGYLFRKVMNDAFAKIGISHTRVVVAPPTTKKTVNRGSQHMDENMCLPAKIVFGNILELADKNVSVVLEWDNCGECRQKTYGLLHQSILRQLGIGVKIVPIQPHNFIQELVRAAPRISSSQWKAVVREMFRGIIEHDRHIMEKQATAPAEKPKIGICGEIFTVLEPAANINLISRLEEQGAYVHSALLLGQFLFQSILSREVGPRQVKWAIGLASLGMWKEIKEWMCGRLKRPDVDYKLLEQAERETSRYLLKHSVGGHGRESVTWMIYYALARFDGVVHIMPFPCMPEATVSALMDEVSRDYGIPVNHLVFDQQFGEQNLITRAEAIVNVLRFRKNGIASLLKTRESGKWLGVDVGSTSVKAVLLDGESLKIIDQEYQFSHRAPMDTLKSVLGSLLSRNPGMNIRGVATTGSGRRLAQALLNAPLAIDEISCQTIGCMLANPDVRSIIEIGGQDSKFIRLDHLGVPNWFNMNSICSAGTGAFLSSAAREFRVPVEQLGSCARAATCGVTITGRCGVFAEADIVSKQQAGYPRDGIIRGMCEALAKNYLSNVCRSQKLEQPVVFTGGVALNSGVERAFSSLVGSDVLVHPSAKVSGALGAAFLSMSRCAVGGICDAAAINIAAFGASTFTCHDCTNDCEVSLIHRNGKIVFAIGSRCGKYDAVVGKGIEEIGKNLCAISAV